LSRLRQEIADRQLDEKSLNLALGGLSEVIERQLRQSLSYSLQPVINATGVILHTNLGRAPLAATTFDHIRATASTYSNLEFELATGERGSATFTWIASSRSFFPRAAKGRPREIAQPLQPRRAYLDNRGQQQRRRGSARAQFVGGSGEVIVREESSSKSWLVSHSRRDVEVQRDPARSGHTNRTRIDDYDRAINDRTRLLLRVHRSNFEITGFTEQPSLDELVALARRGTSRSWKIWAAGLINLRSVE